MQSAREWLVPQGLAKPGRGKYSNAAKAALDAAVAEGTKFSDWPKSDTTVKQSDGTTKKVKAAKPSGVVEEAPAVWGPTTRIFYTENGKRKEYTHAFKMRQCCFHCSVSVSHCLCKFVGRVPQIIVDHKGYREVELTL